jgi:hypothetical protein
MQTLDDPREVEIDSPPLISGEGSAARRDTQKPPINAPSPRVRRDRMGDGYSQQNLLGVGSTALRVTSPIIAANQPQQGAHEDRTFLFWPRQLSTCLAARHPVSM